MKIRSFISIGIFLLSISAMAGEPPQRLKVKNETFEVLKKVSQSSLANGSVLLSVTTHQDLGWLDEIEKCVVMRDTMWITPFMKRMEREVDYEMDIEQTSIIKEYLTRHPDKKSEIVQRLKEGRMLIGSTFTQPYEEMYFSESLARQFYLGKLWLKNELGGYNATSYYNSDVPGRTFQMPQLMARAGVDNMFISRHQRGVFNWKSPDGSGVTVYSPGHYIDFYNILGKEQEDALKALAQQALIWSDGYNDKEGAETVMPAVLNFEFFWDSKPVKNLDPFMEMWNNLKEVENESGERLAVRLPKIKFSTLDKFFTQIRHSTKELPEIAGERPNVWIYIHGPSHRLALDKSRKADMLLPAAEKFAAANAMVSGSYSKYPVELFNQAWTSKIYPDHGWGGRGGESTDAVFLGSFADANAKADRILDNALQSLASKIHASPKKGIPLVVFNSLSWNRNSPVSFSIRLDTETARSIRLENSKGEDIPLQLSGIKTDEEGYLRFAKALFVASEVPSLGYDTYYISLSDKSIEKASEPFNADFENQFFKAHFADGGLSSLIDKELDKELVEDGFFKAGEIFTMKSEGNGAGEFVAVQQPQMEGFDKTGNYATRWEVEEEGPVCSSYRFRQPIRNAVAELKVTFFHQIKKVDFDVALKNWDGTMFREYRMALPLNMTGGDVSYEVPYGVVEVGKDEMPGVAGERYQTPNVDLHPRGIENWISASGNGFGITLSSSVVAMDYVDPTDQNLKKTILQPVLLASRRSCHGEGNDYHQTGHHEFSFSITAHQPGWKNGFRFGKESNEPLFSVVNPQRFERANLPEKMSFLSVDNPDIIVTAMKKAESGDDLVIRYFNIDSEKAPVTFSFWRPFESVWLTSLIEENIKRLEMNRTKLNREVQHHAIETLKFR